jgi:hypothetical protein
MSKKDVIQTKNLQTQFNEYEVQETFSVLPDNSL